MKIKCIHCGETRATWYLWRRFASKTQANNVVCCRVNREGVS